ncbi:MAG: hypothetical protein HWE10_04840 [Gammaproteobacteria bacterium]|nr:hypothetical protein [Gammaproteobacteria bacterium]
MSEQSKIDEQTPSQNFLVGYLQKVKFVVESFWLHLTQDLSTSQKFYFAALVTLLLSMQSESSVFDGFTLTGLLALAALFSEVWPRFVKVWETLLGRVFIVLFYAILANLAVAIAAQKVNEVVGIDPSPLFYTLGFTTVVLAPLWFLGLTAVSMVVYMIALQIWIIIVFLLKLIRVPIYRNTGKTKVLYPILTNVLRVILIPIMLSSLAAVAEVYVGDIDYQLTDESKEKVTNVSNGLKDTIKNQAAKDAGRALNVEEQSALDEVFSSFEQELVGEKQPSSDSAPPIETEKGDGPDDKKILKLIASFVHNIETFEYSQCKKADNERAVFVGETDILISKENPEARLGYEFSVRVCELKTAD